MSFRNSKTGKRFESDMSDKFEQIREVRDELLPRRAGEELQDIYDQSFNKEQYRDKGTSKWKKRKGDKPGQSSHKLLDKTGKLLASGKVRRKGDEISLTAGYPVGDHDLAQIHNEGEGDQEERQFMPKPGEGNKIMDENIEEFLDDVMDSIF